MNRTFGDKALFGSKTIENQWCASVFIGERKASESTHKIRCIVLIVAKLRDNQQCTKEFSFHKIASKPSLK